MTQRSLPVVRLVAVADDTTHKFAIQRFPCSVGRSSRCDVVIADRSMSGRHFQLDLEDGNVVISDLGSTNGMYLDGKRIERVELPQGTIRLRMGNVQIDFQLLEADADKIAKMVINTAAAGDDTVMASAAMPRSGDCYYRRDGREHGPFSWDEMVGMAHTGSLRRSDSVWKEGNKGWMKADCVLGLFGKPAPVEPPPVTATAVDGSSALAPPLPPLVPLVHEQQQQRQPRKYAARGSKGTIVCPHCWHTFDVEDFLYVARHQDLVGDPVLGPDAPQRFLPSKFTAEGNAIDSMGMSCPDVACPYCHLRIPQTAGEMAPLFLSIVGATASGKSYLLTGMIWELRNILAKLFGVSFTDTDAVNNQILNDFEETIFLSSDAEELVALRKTELQGELYNQVMLNGMVINLPRPFMFSIAPSEHHPGYAQASTMSRTLVLYDNAGEHFEPGMDSVDNPTTRHLLHSDTIFFLYDPTKDVRFRKLCSGDDPQLDKHARVQRQEILLTEMVNRIKKYSGMRAGSKSDKTLMVIVPKADLWLHLIDHDFTGEPWLWDGRQNMHTLNLDEIKNVSFAVRHLLERLCPELVVTAESFASEVLYVPTSALGRSPEMHSETGILGIRPKDLQPFWIAVPMLYFFYKHGLILPTPRRLLPERTTTKFETKIAGDVAFISIAELGAEAYRVPLFYAGARLHMPDTQLWFELPTARPPRRSNRAAGSADANQR